MASDMTRLLDDEEQSTHKMRMGNFTRRVKIVSEAGIYETVFKRRKKANL